METLKMVVFVVKRYAVREAKKLRYAVRNVKIQTPRSDYFPWQYIISLPPAMFFAQIQADSFFSNYIFSGFISSKYSFFSLKISNNHN